MDKQHDLTRRKFLLRFAALSSSAVLIQLTGCGDGGGRVLYGPPPVQPVYGPPMVGTTTITGIYYIDAGSQKVDLHAKTGVPASSRFEVLFSADMATDTVTILLLEGNNAVQCTVTWIDARTAEIVPKAVLQANTQYTLLVSNGKDSAGKYLARLDAATFTTATP